MEPVNDFFVGFSACCCCKISNSSELHDAKSDHTSQGKKRKKNLPQMKKQFKLVG